MSAPAPEQIVLAGSGPDHDVRALRELLGEPAIAGFFCNGEIGPVGQSVYLHGFTASLGLFVAK